MKRFWKDIIEPIIVYIAPSHIIEIGADTGINTKNILEYCKKSNCILSSIDPFPSYDINSYKKLYKKELNIIQDISLNVLSKIEIAEVLLIDGDHNWYTVYNELKLIEEQMFGKFPFIIFHDTGWPYGRRDMYYNPDNIPNRYLKKYKKAGILYNQDNLEENLGINKHLFNAVEVNTEKNGVLTAIEDFKKESKLNLELISFEGLNGLTILYCLDNKKLDNYIKQFNIQKKLNFLIESERIKLDYLLQEKSKKYLKSIKLEKKLSKQVKIVEKEKKECQELFKLLENKNKKFMVQNRELSKISEELKNSIIKKDKELLEIKKIAQSLRLKNRFKKLLGITSINDNLFFKLYKSIREDGLSSSLFKVKTKIFSFYVLLKPKKIKTKKHTMPKYTMGEIKKIVSAKQSNNLSQTPLVSIIVLTRDGLHHLERLFSAIEMNTLYPNYEIIIVDNASTDGSMEFIEKKKDNLSIQVIKNDTNVSFSYGNNQAAKLANGEYLLLLNNDIEPLKGWLTNMMYIILSNKNIGSVGAQLIYPYSDDEPYSCLVQHSGIAFNYEYSELLNSSFFRPYNTGLGEQPNFNADLNSLKKRVALTAACLLISKERYFEVDGLDEKYDYGYEDVDLGLKLHQKGYINVYCENALLFHYESSTQKQQSVSKVKDRRLRNMKLLNKKWLNYIKSNYFDEKFNFHQNNIFSVKKLKVAFAVTDAGKDVPEGDYFTAKELADAMSKELGWEICYLRKKHDEWYDIDESVDILITLLDAYDLNKIEKGNKNLITIAWPRNWFDRWVKNSSFESYDFVFASSKIACEYIKENSLKTALLLPIATNPERFDKNNTQDINKYKCDYCFTGSYWNDDREITRILDPEKFPEFIFHVYGKNWEKHKKFQKYDQGFVSYEDIHNIYANTKIVIDDANRVTKPYGSVNSRVFDAISSGVLVITNGKLGSLDLFDGKLPYFETEEELNVLLEIYLKNDSKYQKKVQELQAIVFSKHLYKHRAQNIQNILKDFYLLPSIAIKIPVPKWEVVDEWGDYHFAKALEKQFICLGYRVLIQILPEWDNKQGDSCDTVLVLRGLSRYRPKVHQNNIMWNISHPDKISLEEYEEYDYIFISSNQWAEEISKKVKVPVASMLQCTDEERFIVPSDKIKEEYYQELLFVGNSRKVFRKIIKDLLPTVHNLSIYGTNWAKFVDSKYIKDEHISNDKLSFYYGSCDILLNDHWEDMREKGFISNRIFDGLAAGAFIISDEINSNEKIIVDAVVTYKDKQDLKAKIKFYINNPKERQKIVEKGKKIVLEEHTFSHRVKTFVSTIKKINILRYTN